MSGVEWTSWDSELVQNLSVLYLVDRSGHGIGSQPMNYRTSILQG